MSSRSKKALLLCASAAAMATFWAEAPAHACSTPLQRFGRLIAPRDQAKDVPTNAKIWIDGPPSYQANDPGSFSLQDEDGLLVPTDQTQIRSVYALATSSNSALLTVHSPIHPLKAGKTYRIRLNNTEETTFAVSTSDTPSGILPAKPVAVLKRAFASGRYSVSSCGPANYGDYDVPLNHSIVSLLDIGGQSQIVGTSGIASSASTNPSMFVTWPGAGPYASTKVRFGQFDIAGNFSGWSDFQILRLPASPYESGGCTGGRDTSYANAGVWFIPFFGLLRRRKKIKRYRK